LFERPKRRRLDTLQSGGNVDCWKGKSLMISDLKRYGKSVFREVLNTASEIEGRVYSLWYENKRGKREKSLLKRVGKQVGDDSG